MGQETIQVKALSKYGVQDKDGNYLNWSKKINEAEKGKVVPGGVYTVDMFRAESGKGYINSVIQSELVQTPKFVAPGFKDTPLAKSSIVKTNVSETMSKADWNAKDRSMMIGGISHDAAQLVHASFVANVPLEDVLNAYKNALSEVLDIREEVK